MFFTQVVQHLVKKKHKGCDDVNLAYNFLYRNRGGHYARHLRKVPQESPLQQLQAFLEKWDDGGKGRGWRKEGTRKQPIFLRTTQFRTGTVDEIKALIKHAEKGCLNNPFSFNDLWVNMGETPKTKLVVWKSKAGSSRNEAAHVELNRIRHGRSGTMTSEYVQMLLMLQTLMYNHNIEQQHTPDTSPTPFFMVYDSVNNFALKVR
jgi:hypothetical protein